MTDRMVRPEEDGLRRDEKRNVYMKKEEGEDEKAYQEKMREEKKKEEKKMREVRAITR